MKHVVFVFEKIIKCRECTETTTYNMQCTIFTDTSLDFIFLSDPFRDGKKKKIQKHTENTEKKKKKKHTEYICLYIYFYVYTYIYLNIFRIKLLLQTNTSVCIGNFCLIVLCKALPHNSSI